MPNFVPTTGQHGSVPDVSIIMPVFNKLQLTEPCLDSIHREGAQASYEIIVVDNGSTDGSREWLAGQERLGRLRLIINPDNLGFARGCNLGAAAARGRHLLFLNNDMEVTSGWLEPLVSTLDTDPDVGIVGARLLFADDTIQHGGVALVQVTKDGWTHIGGLHLSYQAPADHKGAQNAQVMQIVTGACLLIRPEVFAAVGGFEERYWNGNEDVDLCLKVRELGWDVVYRGESVVYHYESQSGPERFSQVERNVKTFNEIWFGRAKPDFVQAADGHFSPTADNQIRPYAAPRLLYHDHRRGGRDEAKPPRASIIVLTWNALEHTRRCVASLLEHTDSRHELIFVDNGSTDGTEDWLGEVARSQPRVRVILNNANLGFAAGNNVGLAAARGDFMVLLNSDTVVTAGWLDRLMRPALADARVGLVGPVTNNVTGVQKLARVGYDQESLQGLEGFAARHAAEHAGKSSPALWIVGFCLLLRRDVVERLGGLDVIFGQGNYEDTDYCLRAFLAGFRSAVALDCFIHHVGSASFDAAGVDYRQQMNANFEVFRRKWNLDADVRRTGQFNLPEIISSGMVAPLQFRPLPSSPHYDLTPLPDWEAGAWLTRGEEAFGRGDIEEAELWLRAVQGLRPELARAANDLACVLWRRDPEGEGRREAVRLLEGVLARDPDDEDARWNLAEMAGRNAQPALAARP
ncbi:MAG: glycosyltransferase [bacterium]|jgi:GT2 family glycosyltransferase|nr:glycosyltransferase [bacterium]